MGNLIHNYLQNNQNLIQNQREVKQTRSYISAPSVDSTMDSFDRETDKLIKPLDGKGYLVDDNPIYAPKEFVRDTVYTTKALADGVRGKANDHQLGKLNDLGLKVGGLAIATYLMTRKTTPKQKLMEFIGFGTFLLSMKLWPKIALEIPARIIHGFNYRKKYVDDQGRKKEVGLDPNYMPFDLYRGDKKSEDLNVIGDRLGIRKDLVNRQEAVKDQMRKISVQNNTMWMLTAGIATPIMTALACNKIEDAITPWMENRSNTSENRKIDKAYKYLDGKMDKPEREAYEKSLGFSDTNPTEELLKDIKNKELPEAKIAELSETLAQGFNADMKESANADLRKIIGGKKYLTNSKTTQTIAGDLHKIVAKSGGEVAQAITPEKLEKAISQGAIRGAVRNMLTSIGLDVIDKTPRTKENEAIHGILDRLSTNFKSKDVGECDFFKVNDANRAMTPQERLAYNIKEIVLKVNNADPKQDFISQMSALEGAHKGKEMKAVIDEKLIAQADDIAKQFYEGTLAVGDKRHDYVTKAVGALFKSDAPDNDATRSVFHRVKTALTSHYTKQEGYIITESAAKTIGTAAKAMQKYRAVDRILNDGIHFKVEKANETLVANNWAEVSNTLFKELNITDADLKLASKDKNVANEIFTKRLEEACSDENSFKKLITSLGNKMAELDEKMDNPNADSEGRMMEKLEKGIEKNSHRTGDSLAGANFREMRQSLVSSEHSGTGLNIGSIMNAKKERLHSRINGVHGSYMRLIQTCEFFHRADGYTKAMAELNKDGADLNKILAGLKLETTPPADKPLKDFLREQIAVKYGFDADEKVSKELISRGKGLLLRAHTNKYYNKMETINNPNFFQKLMKAVFRPSESKEWDQGWSAALDDTFKILNDNVKTSEGANPVRAFEDYMVEGVKSPKGFGQKLKEHMNLTFNTLGNIERNVYEGIESLKVGSGAAPKDARASAIFDMVGKAPSELFFDTAKQKYNTGKWMKTFKPILALTFVGTVLSQFFFGKKDADIKA